MRGERFPDIAELRATLRNGLYEADRVGSRRGFTEDVQTVAALLTWQVQPDVSAHAGLDESRRDETLRTTLRAGGTFDDGRASRVALDGALRELLTNPVAAVPRRGSTDRVTLDAWHRFAAIVAGSGHVEYRHYRVASQDLGDHWDLGARAEVDALRRPFRLTLAPLLFFSDYSPSAERPLRDEITFLRRQEIIGFATIVSGEPFRGLTVSAEVTPRYDVHRDVSAVEVSTDARWRLRDRVQLELRYVHNSESLRVGGREDTIALRVTMLY